MKNKLSVVVVLAFILASINCHSQYEVWLGTTCTPRNSILKKETWANTAQLVEGLNINNTPVNPAAGTPSEGEESLTTGQFNNLVNTYELGGKNGFIPVPRTFFKSDAFPDRDDLIPFLENRFAQVDQADYTVNGIMFFDNFVGSDPSTRVVYKYTLEEVQTMRNWLDANRPNVKLIYNARNNGAESRGWCESPLVANVAIEAKPQLWYNNGGSRQTLLKWLWTNPNTINKRIIFQVPVNTMTNPYGTPNGFQQFRDFMRWLGTDLMDFNFMRSNRVVIMPVTYNPAFTFYPETINDGTTYDNTMTGIALSLIEQRRLFQGLDGTPTQAQVYDNTRYAALSTNDFELDDSAIKLFPNPSKKGHVVNFKNLKSDDIEQIIVTDITGKIIQSHSKGNTIKITNADTGLYFVKFRFDNENNFITKKLIIN
ncbi:T9SS type A sorting domain-containing protein [Algibacter lectus]|uniref:T9SS type A sorting domain-containing protein n=1 Tax=Algibacter lectus TaxID=221126 RepID=UPI0024944CB1|nr:T9SS type A sorting domain-containing protein [Algibacter lectus]